MNCFTGYWTKGWMVLANTHDTEMNLDNLEPEHIGKRNKGV